MRIAALFSSLPSICLTLTELWPRGYKTSFILNSAEHEITKMPTNEAFLALNLSDVVFIMLINIIVGILTFMGRINFVLS